MGDRRRGRGEFGQGGGTFRHERLHQRDVSDLSVYRAAASCGDDDFYASSTIMNQILPPDQLGALRQFTTPTISNALERLGLPHALDNQSDGSIKCIFPDLGVVVGYAVTATIRSAA